MKAFNIQWDIDEGEEVTLPNEIEIPDGMTDEEEISDYITDYTGFCHKGFELSEEASMEKWLKEQIGKVISDIAGSLLKLEDAKGTKKITEYMNIGHGIGKYHAFLETLVEINLDEFVKTHDRYSAQIDRALKRLEGLYHES